jgi:hypothetical protein
LPGLTRQSMRRMRLDATTASFAKPHVSMDTRVKPAYDESMSEAT